MEGMRNHGTRQATKLQNRAARIVANSPYNASALPIIRKLGWQTVNDSTVKETLKMVYQCTNDEAPSYLACLFDRLLETSSWELRKTKSIYASRFYQQHAAKNTFHFEG